MINHIKNIWDDVELIEVLSEFERNLLNQYNHQVQEGILLKKNDRLYIAGWHQDDILIIDNEIGKPLIRLSGKFR